MIPLIVQMIIINKLKIICLCVTFKKYIYMPQNALYFIHLLFYIIKQIILLCMEYWNDVYYSNVKYNNIAI